MLASARGQTFIPNLSGFSGMYCLKDSLHEAFVNSYLLAKKVCLIFGRGIHEMNIFAEGEETLLWNRFIESLNTNKFIRIRVHLYLGKFVDPHEDIETEKC